MYVKAVIWFLVMISIIVGFILYALDAPNFVWFLSAVGLQYWSISLIMKAHKVDQADEKINSLVELIT